MTEGFPCYVHVYNTAMHQTVSMEKERLTSFEEAKELKARLENEYGQIGCHEVRVLVEIYPNKEEDPEEDFDADEMEEEE